MNTVKVMKLGSLVFLVFVVQKTQPLDLIYATSTEDQEKGLGGRDSLPQNTGMLFVFDMPDTYGFWMKDMHFPIDIIWLNKDMMVTYVAQNVSPASYPEVFKPETPSLYVLEVNSGYTKANTIGVGTNITRLL